MQNNREIKIGDVFTYGIDKLVISELPKGSPEWRSYNYHHYTKEPMSSVNSSTGGHIKETEFPKWISSGRVKFEYNLFDIVMVGRFSV